MRYYYPMNKCGTTFLDFRKTEHVMLCHDDSSSHNFVGVVPTMDEKKLMLIIVVCRHLSRARVHTKSPKPQLPSRTKKNKFEGSEGSKYIFKKRDKREGNCNRKRNHGEGGNFDFII